MGELLTVSERLTHSRERMHQALAQSAPNRQTSDNVLVVAGTFAKEAVDTAVHPFAQRNPFGLVAGAALVGGLIAWSRPWRWLLTPVVASMLPVLVSRVVRGTPPLTLMNGLRSLIRPRKRPSLY